MKFQEIIEWARKQPGRVPDMEALLDSGDFDFPVNFDHYNHAAGKFREVGLIQWTCTDTDVGWSMIFDNDVPIALCYVASRKSPAWYYWISNCERDPRKRIIDWIYNCMLEEEEKDHIFGHITYIPYDEDYDITMAELMGSADPIPLTVNVFRDISLQKNNT